jgi:hypothetical protein
MGVRRLAPRHSFVKIFCTSFVLLARCDAVWAGSLRLTWSDNSSNETGFRIERKTGTGGSFALVATVAANAMSHVDTGLIDGTTYCYRVRAYNGSSVSSYSNESCSVATSTVQQYTLNVGKAGTGSGTVTSAPTGITCGTDCSQSYNSGTGIVLTATPAAGSVFAGWNNSTCGNFNITSNTTCTATFNLSSSATYLLTVNKSGSGAGTVTSAPAGINCGSDCTENYSSGMKVTLFASAAAGSSFAGWNPAGCGNAVMTTNLSCTAMFQAGVGQFATKIGVFRPTTGEWFLDLNGNGTLDGCSVDKCIPGYGNGNWSPIVGDWFGDGKSRIGAFEARTGAWHLDDGDGIWESCGSSGDICITSFGGPGTRPVAKDLATANRVVIGTFQDMAPSNGNLASVKQGLWKFDTDGDGVVDNCNTDECIENFGAAGDLPVVGDWSRAGADAIGFFRSGAWYLDYNNNGKWDGPTVDRFFSSFGVAGDLPIVGDWDGTGAIRIGIFRPSTGTWFLDLNGNGRLDACGVDICFGPFGKSGDLPVAGKW